LLCSFSTYQLPFAFGDRTVIRASVPKTSIHEEGELTSWERNIDIGAPKGTAQAL